MLTKYRVYHPPGNSFTEFLSLADATAFAELHLTVVETIQFELEETTE